MSVEISKEREEVIRKFRYDFERDLLSKSKKDALELAGKRLGCSLRRRRCRPKRWGRFE